MCSSATASSSNTTLDDARLVKFVELLVHDYLQAKGFTATGEKFAEECSKCAGTNGAESGGKHHRTVGSAGSAPGPTAGDDGAPVDEVDSWYYLADKLALPVGLQAPSCVRVSSACKARHPCVNVLYHVDDVLQDCSREQTFGLV